MTYDVFMKLLAVAAAQGAGTTLAGTSLLAMFCLLYVTGFRKAEIIDCGAGPTYLMRSSLVWNIGGVALRDPTAAQYRSLKPGDYVEVWPRQSKCDATGEVWGALKIICSWGTYEGNACRALAALELRQPVHGDTRSCFPLFCDEQGVPMRAASADRIINSLLALAIGAGLASTFSWHSFRIGLATRLSRVGCPVDKILALCRWQNASSLLVYRRFCKEDFDQWQQASLKAVATSGTINPLPDAGDAFEELEE